VPVARSQRANRAQQFATPSLRLLCCWILLRASRQHPKALPICVGIVCDQSLDRDIALFHETKEPAFCDLLVANSIALMVLQQLEALLDRFVILRTQELTNQSVLATAGPGFQPLAQLDLFSKPLRKLETIQVTERKPSEPSPPC
jgi:hypothetical protein